jgi:hypothetical protein
MAIKERRRLQTPSGRKGAIELSLGFIVAVVFAVVLLSLAILWLQGIIGNIGSLTDDLTQQAQSKLQETFQTTQNNFAVWPDRYNLDRGKELKLSSGIKNDAEDGQNHQFVINVVPAAASRGPCASGDIGSCTAPGGKSLSEFMQNWVSWDNQPGVIQINRVGYRTISVNVPPNAVAGTYIFNVIACMDMYSYSECTSQTLNWGGSAQQLTITVK